MKTTVISAFPACGKSYAFNNYQEYYSIIDSDSSEFSWVKDKDGNNTKERNPNFPQNYINHIKDNIGKVDIIFVSSHEQVRKAMKEAEIHYCTVYPKEEMLNEWIGRMYQRGNDEKFIQFIKDNWDNFMSEIKSGVTGYGFGILRIGNNEYLDLLTLDALKWNYM